MVQAEPAVPEYVPWRQLVQPSADADPRADPLPAAHSPVQSSTESWRTAVVAMSTRYLPWGQVEQGAAAAAPKYPEGL